LKERINALGGEPTAEKGTLPVPESRQSLKVMVELLHESARFQQLRFGMPEQDLGEYMFRQSL
jgi:hypothetical protein